MLNRLSSIVKIALIYFNIHNITCKCLHIKVEIIWIQNNKYRNIEALVNLWYSL